MKKTEIRYYCDVCGKEVNEYALKKCDIPSIKWDCEGRRSQKSVEKMELCSVCFNAWWKISNKYFAEIDSGYEIKVNVKYKEVQEDD